MEDAKEFIRNSIFWFAGLTQFSITEDELAQLLTAYDNRHTDNKTVVGFSTGESFVSLDKGKTWKKYGK